MSRLSLHKNTGILNLAVLESHSMYLILFTIIALLSLCVIYSNNIVYSLLCLISVFFLCGILLIALHVEFLGYMLIIVYVGAIAILFLFVVMTLDIAREEKNTKIWKKKDLYFSLSHLVGFSYVIFVIYLTVKLVKRESD